MRNRAEDRQTHDGRGDLPPRHAGGLRHDNLAVLVDPVERPDPGHEQGQWHQKRDDLRRPQHDDVEIRQRRLPIFEDQVSTREPLCQKRKQCEPADDNQNRAQDFIKQVRLDFRHRVSRAGK
jgi:hypothetical protein